MPDPTLRLACVLTSDMLVDAATLLKLAPDASPEERAISLRGARQLIRNARQSIQRIEAGEMGHLRVVS